MGTEEDRSGRESGTVQDDEYWFTRIDEVSLEKHGHPWREGLPAPGQFSIDYILIKATSHITKLRNGSIDPDDGIPHWAKILWYRRAYETFKERRVT